METSMMMFAPILLSSLMTTVAPIAFMSTAMQGDTDRLVRGIVQSFIVSGRAAADIRYDEIVLDDRTGDFSIRGLKVSLPLSAGVPGCAFTVDAVTIVSLDRPDALAFSSEADRITIDPKCAAGPASMVLGMLGPGALNIQHYSSTLNYHLGSSTLDYAMLLETEAVGSIALTAQVEGLHFDADKFGDQQPQGMIKNLEVTAEDSDTLLGLLPMFGIEDGPADMVADTLRRELNADGISEPEQALIDSADKELGRWAKEGGAITLRTSPGISVSFRQILDTDGPEEVVPLLAPIFSSVPAGADFLISSEMLEQAMTAVDDLSAKERLRIANALATGKGAPRSFAMAADLLEPLAADGNAEAAARYAAILHEKGDALHDAYRYALMAGAGKAQGARTLLDQVEADMALADILDIQTKTVGTPSELIPDIASLRMAARSYAQGQGVPRNYAHAYLLASLAGAAGDVSALRLNEKLASRFDQDEDVNLWQDVMARQSDAALKLWASGFGDGFAARE